MSGKVATATHLLRTEDGGQSWAAVRVPEAYDHTSHSHWCRAVYDGGSGATPAGPGGGQRRTMQQLPAWPVPRWSHPDHRRRALTHRCGGSAPFTPSYGARLLRRSQRSPVPRSLAARGAVRRHHFDSKRPRRANRVGRLSGEGRLAAPPVKVARILFLPLPM